MLKHCVCLSGRFMTIRKLCSSNQWIHSSAPLSKHQHFKAKPLVLCFITLDTPTERYLSAKCNVLNLQLILKRLFARFSICTRAQNWSIHWTKLKFSDVLYVISTPYCRMVPSVERNKTASSLHLCTSLKHFVLKNSKMIATLFYINLLSRVSPMKE